MLPIEAPHLGGAVVFRVVLAIRVYIVIVAIARGPGYAWLICGVVGVGGGVVKVVVDSGLVVVRSSRRV